MDEVGLNVRGGSGRGGSALEGGANARVAHLAERGVALATPEEVGDEEVAVAVGRPEAAVGVAVADVSGSCS